MKPYGAIMSPLEFSQLCQEAVARRADYLVLRFDSKSGDFWSPKSRFRADRAAVVFHFETKDQYVSLEIGPHSAGDHSDSSAKPRFAALNSACSSTTAKYRCDR